MGEAQEKVYGETPPEGVAVIVPSQAPLQVTSVFTVATDSTGG